MIKTGVRIGTATLAIGLSLAGPQAAGVAAADTDAGSDAPAVSTRSARPATAPAAARAKSTPSRPAASRRAPRAAAAVPTPRQPTPRLPKPAVKLAARVAAPVAAPIVVAPVVAPTALTAPAAAKVAPAQAASPVITGIANVLDGLRNWLNTLPANPVSDFLEGALLSLRRALVPDPVIESPVASPAVPTITIHNSSTQQTLWVYNLTTTGNYSIPATPWTTDQGVPADWVGPVSIAPGASAPVTLAVYNAAPGSPANRIYFVEGDAFTLPITSTSGIDPFNPTASPAGDTFQNYSFIEYNLYPATGGGYQYTIDTSYIDEWSLPVQMKFTLNGSGWAGAVDGKTYGFSDFDTVVNQLTAAGGPYSDLVWSGSTPWDPQPPAGVVRIIGPDKVWAAQSFQPPSNINMNTVGWVPTSYQNFVTAYPYNGTQVSGTSQDNYDFWRFNVDGPASTPYAIALRTAAVQDGFAPDANGVYGFFTYPNDEAAGQFTNIPTATSLDIYVWGAGDGASASVVPGGVWRYSSSAAPTGATGPRVKVVRGTLAGTAASDTFVLNYTFQNPALVPLVQGAGTQGDVVGIDAVALGATSTSVAVVDWAWFLCNPNQSQFVYERATGNLYYDQNPSTPGYSGLLANLSQSSLNPASIVVL